MTFFVECSVDVLVSFEQGRIENGLMGLIHLLGFWGLWIGGWGGIFWHILGFVLFLLFIYRDFRVLRLGFWKLN